VPAVASSIGKKLSITPNLVLGLVAVFAGIWIATTESGKA
jgi:hypothetical protein